MSAAAIGECVSARVDGAAGVGTGPGVDGGAGDVTTREPSRLVRNEELALGPPPQEEDQLALVLSPLLSEEEMKK